MDADTVARELYTLRPAEFVAARDAQVAAARAAGDRELASEIKSMRRPTAAAWVANLFALEQGERLEQLFSLGAALREAQSTLSADKLRRLGQQRRQVIGALAEDAAALAGEHGQAVTAAVVGDVEQTLQAALADADAAELVRAGRLTTTLSYTGFGEAGTGSANADPAPTRATRSRRPAKGEDADRRAELRSAAQEAEATLASATEEADGAERRLEQARADRDEHASAAKDLERRLQEARAHAADAEHEIDAAKQAHRDAVAGLKTARAAAKRARTAAKQG